jgi:hypothetical protein
LKMDKDNNSTIKQITDEIIRISPFLGSDNREDFQDFIETFGKGFSRYAEISTSPHSDTVGLMTRGVGKEFENKIRDFTKKAQVKDKSITLFDEIAHYFSDINILIKYDFHQEKKFDFSLYWQYLVPVHLLSRMARKFGISAGNIQLLNELSRLMRQRSLFLGLSFDHNGDVGFRIFFSNALHKSSAYIAPSLAALLAKTGVDADNINNFIAYHNFISPVAAGSIFTSVGFDKTGTLGAKIDYEIVPVENVRQIMRALSIPRSEEEKLQNVMNTIEMSRLTYLGIRFAPGRKPQLKFYFDRRYSEKNKGNSEILADILQGTIWTP